MLKQALPTLRRFLGLAAGAALLASALLGCTTGTPAAPEGSGATTPPMTGIGLLQLKLSQPSTITLSSAGGDRSTLKGSSGELTLQLQSPVSLRVTPPPKDGDEVLWDGLPQTSLNGEAGNYRLPQRDPRSP